MSRLSDDRKEEIAKTLAEHLTLYYPNGPPAEQAQIKQWVEQLVESELPAADNNDSYNGETSSSSVEYKSIQSAISVGVQRWKSPEYRSQLLLAAESVKPKATTFSWLNQLEGGLGPLIRMEDILEAPSNQERLALFRKMFLDDVAPDWAEIRPIMSQVIQQQHLIDKDDDDNNNTLFIDYLRLYRKWFDQGRSSTEYLSLQYDLCRSILQAIQTHVASSTLPEDDPKLLLLLQTWRDMWLDLMQRGLYYQDLAEDMEISVLLLMRDLSVSSLVEEAVVEEEPNATRHNGAVLVPVLPAHVMAMIDTRALWFHSWTSQVSTQRLVILLERSGLFPEIWGRCFAMMPCNDSSTLGVVLKDALALSSLAMVRAILVKTRVALFPWHLLGNIPNPPLSTKDIAVNAATGAPPPPNNGSTTTVVTSSKVDTARLEALFLGRLLDMLKSDLAHDDYYWTRLCEDAIETILWGCKRNDPRFALLLSTVKDRLMNDKRTTLQALLHRIE
jgi:hypothetical protein